MLKTIKFPILAISISLLSLVTSCNKNDDDGTMVPSVSIKFEEDTNDKSKTTVIASSSVTTSATYKWQVTDQNGIHDVNGTPDGRLTWQLVKGDTEFCVSVITAEYPEGIKECATFSKEESEVDNINCEDKLVSIVSGSEFIREFAIKGNQLYYSKSSSVGLSDALGVYIYKVDITEENPVPVAIIYDENIKGRVFEMEFKEDILYISVFQTLFGVQKVYKIDTREATPCLIEVLDGHSIRAMVFKGNNLYIALASGPNKIFKMDVTATTPLLTEFTTVQGMPILLAFSGDELYVAAHTGPNGHYISKININNPNLEEEILISNIQKSIISISLKDNELYLATSSKEGSKSIEKFNVTSTSPTLEKIGENYAFESLELISQENWLYIRGYRQDNSFGIVKIPFCSL